MARIGKVDEASHAIDQSYLVVDTGPWIFGRKVMLPAGTVTHIDHDRPKVYLDRTKEQVKNSPEYDETAIDTMQADSLYRDKLGDYYTESYRDRS